MDEMTPLQLALWIERVEARLDALDRRVKTLARDSHPPVDFSDIYGRMQKLEQAATITRRKPIPLQTRASAADPDRG